MGAHALVAGLVASLVGMIEYGIVTSMPNRYHCVREDDDTSKIYQ